MSDPVLAADAVTSPARWLRGYVHRKTDWYWRELELRSVARPAADVRVEGEMVAVRSMDDIGLIDAVRTDPDWRGASPQERFEHGAVAWAFVLPEGRPVLTLWTFGVEMPMDGLERGWLSAPPGAAFTEDLVVAPDMRGLGVAPTATADLVDSALAEGYTHFLTRILTSNGSGQRTSEKAGWRRVAGMQIVNVGPRVSTHAQLVEGGGTHGPRLVAELDGRSFYRLRHRAVSEHVANVRRGLRPSRRA